jgi:hypothetical protein
VDKTHTNSNVFQYIPNDFKKDFIRGFLDGDGCLTYNLPNSGNWRKISLCFCNGTLGILKDISNYFIDIPGSVIADHTTYFTLRYDKIKSVQMVVQKIYESATLYLNRKKIIADKILSYYSNTVLTRHIAKG